MLTQHLIYVAVAGRKQSLLYENRVYSQKYCYRALSAWISSTSSIACLHDDIWSTKHHPSGRSSPPRHSIFAVSAKKVIDEIDIRSGLHAWEELLVGQKEGQLEE